VGDLERLDLERGRLPGEGSGTEEQQQKEPE
jgi:hypothetical protein